MTLRRRPFVPHVRAVPSELAPSRPASVAIVAAVVALLGGCAVGPNYRRPEAMPKDVDMPPAWTAEAPWQQARPDDAALRGDWWVLYGDAQLDTLEQQALAANQTLQVAAVRLAQAREQVRATSSSLLPEVDATGNLGRSRTSGNRPLSLYSTPTQSIVQSDSRIALSVNYELDLFGRLRRTVEGVVATAEQTAADFANARLVLTADVATNYFNLRELDTEMRVVREGIVLQQKALDYIAARHDLGVASGLELAQQQAVLESSGTQLHLLETQRAQYQHALATLTGVPAAGFVLAAAELTPVVPELPVGVPSDVLQRRPDVAASERAMAAANARIGIARAAYYPSISLQPNIGWESRMLPKLFDASSLLWSLGVSATQVLFDAGRRDALTRIAEGDYTIAVANYRQSVLTAMQEVENGVTGLAALGSAAGNAERSVRGSQRALDLANDRYSGGLATYLEVITSQQTLLSGQRTQAQIAGQRLQTSVYLVKALGGGWIAPEPAVAGRFGPMHPTSMGK